VFQKGNKCRFLFPFKYCNSTKIYPNDQEVTIATPWHRLSNPDVVWVSPWLLTPKREIGSEYVNTYNKGSLKFSELHTNKKFTYLKKRKHWVIPTTYYEGTVLCGLEHLNLDDDINHTNIASQKNTAKTTPKLRY
jgi:hypothetical protein